MTNRISGHFGSNGDAPKTPKATEEQIINAHLESAKRLSENPLFGADVKDGKLVSNGLPAPRLEIVMMLTAMTVTAPDKECVEIVRVIAEAMHATKIEKFLVTIAVWVQEVPVTSEQAKLSGEMVCNIISSKHAERVVDGFFTHLRSHSPADPVNGVLRLLKAANELALMDELK